MYIVEAAKNPIILMEATNKETKWQSELKNFYKKNHISIRSNYEKDSELYLYLKDAGDHVYKCELADNVFIVFPLQEESEKYVKEEHMFNHPKYFNLEINMINGIIKEEYTKDPKVKNYKILRYYLLDYEGNPATDFVVVSDDLGIAEYEVKYDSVKSYCRVNRINK